MEKAWGVGDPDDVQHHKPIFLWELVEGIRVAGPPATPWELAGTAMCVVSSLGARRGGGASSLLLGDVSEVAPDAVEVAPRKRPKNHRERATRRPRKQAIPVVLRHWTVREYVIPWLRWHDRRKSPATALLFPAITTSRAHATKLGFTASGQWVEPLRQWSARQRRCLLEKYIPGVGKRAFHGFRAGNQMELRRWREVSVVTRRVLHGRSLRHAIGSEAAYDEVFAEDFAEATERLGRLRIERSRNGLLTVTAMSPSAGRNPGDWIPAPGGALALTPESEGSSGSSSDDSSSDAGGSTDDAEVVGDGGRETRVFACGRCGLRLGAQDYGFLCDSAGCAWGVCTACHPGGSRAPLACPRHAHR
jgi:hypothetical protein